MIGINKTTREYTQDILAALRTNYLDTVDGVEMPIQLTKNEKVQILLDVATLINSGVCEWSKLRSTRKGD